MTRDWHGGGMTDVHYALTMLEAQAAKVAETAITAKQIAEWLQKPDTDFEAFVDNIHSGNWDGIVRQLSHLSDDWRVSHAEFMDALAYAGEVLRPVPEAIAAASPHRTLE